MREPRRPAPGGARRWVEPLAVGGAAIGVIAGLAMLLGGGSVVLPLLLPVLAAVLGWRYGALHGGAGACVPIAVLMVAEVARELAGGAGGAGPVPTLLIGISVVLLLAFCAFLAAAIRGRYGRPPGGSGSAGGSAYTSSGPWRS